MWTAVLLFAAGAAALSADIFFPDTRDSRRTPGAQIPLSLLLRMSEVEDLSGFNAYMDEVILENRLDSSEAPVVPKNAVCTPELQVVPLVTEKQPDMLYFPSCTRVERCEGCCASELLACQSIRNQTINYTVFMTQYTGGNTVSLKKRITVSVEKHLECQCGCAVKEQDCHSLQVYDKDSCLCKCVNTADEERCRTENDTKLWDTQKCMCSCRRLLSCSSGYHYDLNSCSCSEDVASRLGAVSAPGRAPPRSEPRPPPPVLPLRSSSRRRQRQPLRPL
ncbi:balbiani ring protein 3-like [Bacillus rossius redtenbacheri]|uniref:balbiani ring protein 3-like n=1 Tax=Bacillus rossius redtenbacheri TaxID=93214 RepID=UPI002FDCE2A1